MNASAVVRAGHRVGLLAVAILALSACASSPFAHQSGSNSHACADTFAKAITSIQPVKGTWACLSSDLQNSINATGQANGDSTFADASLAQVQVTLTFVGQQGDLDAYHILLIAPGQTPLSYALMVWQNTQGLVTNYDVSTGVW